MNYRFVFRHSCPYLNREHSIYIDYAKVDIIGDPKTHYKLMGYSCEYSEECPYPAEDNYGRCPVLMAAPEEPY